MSEIKGRYKMARKTKSGSGADKKKPVFSARRRSGITGNSAISLAQSRQAAKPPLFASKHTRQIIRRHHTLLKQQATLRAEIKSAQNGGGKSGVDVAALEQKIRDIDEEIKSNGGIKEYQKASIAGQSAGRGGDTSKLLVSWLTEEGSAWKTPVEAGKPYSLLEIGCLSATNECSTCGIFGPIERIDLNSQDPANIKQQDFMERPLPKRGGNDSTDRFDFISLSLVVNYVPDHYQRGEMLKRCVQFLKPPKSSDAPFPGLFFVLPAPCVLNSRYMTEPRLNELMESLGFKLERRKETAKLVYWLYRLVGKPAAGKTRSFKREEISPGGNKNNFSICLR